MQIICSLISSAAFFFNFDSPRENVWCNDPITFATSQTNMKCAAQGYLFIYGLLAILTWWLVLAVNVFLAVVMEKRNELAKFVKYYHIVGWGVPFIFATTLAAQEEIGYAPPTAWCFINSDVGGFSVETTVSTFGPDYIFFYIPIGVVTLLATVTFVLALIKIVKVRRSTLRLSGGSAITRRYQQRLLVFVAALIVIFVFIFEWRITLQLEDVGSFESLDVAWAACRVKEQLGIPTDPEGCPPGSSFPKTFDFSHTAFETFIASSSGIFMFLIFGTDPTIYPFWFFILKCIWSRKWDLLAAHVSDSNQKRRPSEVDSSTIRSSSPSVTNLTSSASSFSGSTSPNSGGGVTFSLEESSENAVAFSTFSEQNEDNELSTTNPMEQI